MRTKGNRESLEKLRKPAFSELWRTALRFLFWAPHSFLRPSRRERLGKDQNFPPIPGGLRSSIGCGEVLRTGRGQNGGVCGAASQTSYLRTSRALMISGKPQHRLLLVPGEREFGGEQPPRGQRRRLAAPQDGGNDVGSEVSDAEQLTQPLAALT